jgi:protease IV
MLHRMKSLGIFESVCGMLAVMLLMGLATGCGTPSLLITPVSRTDRLQEMRVDVPEKASQDKIVIIAIEGLIANARGSSPLGSTENRLSLIAQQLDKAAKDDRVKAVVLRINSPGGTVTGSDTLYELVKRFREETKKPVIASCQEVAASGGYYVACAADSIVAQPTSVVGSIGVIYNSFHVDQLMSRVGVTSEVVKSGTMKDMGSPFHPLTPEERKLMQQMVDEYFARFTAVVRKHRKPKDEAVFATSTDGRVMTGEQAKKVGLVDELGLLEDAIELARQTANSPRAVGVMYRRPFGYSGSVYATAPNTPTSDQPQKLTLDIGAFSPDLPAGFYYLWRP